MIKDDLVQSKKIEWPRDHSTFWVADTLSFKMHHLFSLTFLRWYRFPAIRTTSTKEDVSSLPDEDSSRENLIGQETLNVWVKNVWTRRSKIHQTAKSPDTNHSNMIVLLKEEHLIQISHFFCTGELQFSSGKNSLVFIFKLYNYHEHAYQQFHL